MFLAVCIGVTERGVADGFKVIVGKFFAVCRYRRVFRILYLMRAGFRVAVIVCMIADDLKFDGVIFKHFGREGGFPLRLAHFAVRRLFPAEGGQGHARCSVVVKQHFDGAGGLPFGDVVAHIGELFVRKFYGHFVRLQVARKGIVFGGVCLLRIVVGEFAVFARDHLRIGQVACGVVARQFLFFPGAVLFIVVIRFAGGNFVIDLVAVVFTGERARFGRCDLYGDGVRFPVGAFGQLHRVVFKRFGREGGFPLLLGQFVRNDRVRVGIPADGRPLIAARKGEQAEREQSCQTSGKQFFHITPPVK